MLVFGPAVWGGSLTANDKHLVNRVKRCALRIVGKTLVPLEAVYSRIQQMGHKILADKKHPLNHIFELVSGIYVHAQTEKLDDPTGYQSAKYVNVMVLHSECRLTMHYYKSCFHLD